MIELSRLFIRKFKGYNLCMTTPKKLIVFIIVGVLIGLALNAKLNPDEIPVGEASQ